MKVDEDPPSEVAEVVRSAGYDAQTVLEQGSGGAKDDVLWRAVQGEARLLITADKGFGDIRESPPGTHGGVLLLRPDGDGIAPLLDLVRRVTRSGILERLRDTLAVVTKSRIRIRKPAPDRGGADHAHGR